MKIRITAQNGHVWEEEVDDLEAASKAIREEHDDIESIVVVDDDGHLLN